MAETEEAPSPVPDPQTIEDEPMEAEPMDAADAETESVNDGASSVNESPEKSQENGHENNGDADESSSVIALSERDDAETPAPEDDDREVATPAAEEGDDNDDAASRTSGMDLDDKPTESGEEKEAASNADDILTEGASDADAQKAEDGTSQLVIRKGVVKVKRKKASMGWSVKDLELTGVSPSTGLPLTVKEKDIPYSPRGGGSSGAGRGGGGKLNADSIVGNPQYILPFEHGWRREMVVRNTDSGTGSRGNSDIYYFSPTNKKLRSLVQIGDYLTMTGSTLDVSNFTFFKGRIHEEPQEVVRQAGIGRRSAGGLGLSPATKEKKTPKEKKMKIKITKPKTPVGVVRPSAAGLIIGQADGTAIPNLAGINYIPPMPNLMKKGPVAKKRPTGSLIKTIKRPPGNYPSLTPIPKKPRMELGPDGLPRLCSLECPGQEGLPPSLHCKVCLCLFHPSCVGFPETGNTDQFICQTCEDFTGQKDDFPIPNGAGNIRGPPPLHPIKPMVNSPPSLTPAPNRPRMVNVGANMAQNQNVSGHMITLPPAVLQRLNPQQKLTLLVNQQRIQVPPSMLIHSPEGVKLYLPSGIIPNAPVASNEPARPLTLLTNPKDPQTLTIKQMPAPAPKPKTVEPAVQPTVVAPTAPAPVEPPPPAKSPEPVHIIPDDDSDSEKAVTPPASPKSRDLPPRTTRTRQVKGINPAACHFQKFHAGYDVMPLIFKNLPVADLLRAGRVCRLWHTLSSSSLLWKSVKLQGSGVTNWEGLAKCLMKQGTTSLDMRGMIHPDGDQNRTWHELTAVLEGLTSLKQVHFAECPALILHSLSEKISGLKSLTADSVTDTFDEAAKWSTNTKLDLGKFGKLAQLETLKIRGLCGLVLPAFSFCGGLDNLKNLTKLKNLSLTTLREVQDSEFQFLGALTELETLELGDCTNWEPETFAQLGELKQLRSLRLEHSSVSIGDHLGEALSQLDNLTHLELIGFHINHSLAQNLKKMKALKNLSVWPLMSKEAAKVNSLTLEAVSSLTNLEGLDWGVMPVPSPPTTPGGSVAEQEGFRNDQMPFLPPAGEEGDAHVNQDPDYCTANTHMQRLVGLLPQTKIRVFRVPAHNPHKDSD